MSRDNKEEEASYLPESAGSPLLETEGHPPAEGNRVKAEWFFQRPSGPTAPPVQPGGQGASQCAIISFFARKDVWNGRIHANIQLSLVRNPHQLQAACGPRAWMGFQFSNQVAVHVQSSVSGGWESVTGSQSRSLPRGNEAWFSMGNTWNTAWFRFYPPGPGQVLFTVALGAGGQHVPLGRGSYSVDSNGNLFEHVNL